MSLDALTARVRDLYSQYPFPNTEYRVDYGLHLLRFFAQVARNGQKSFLETACILDAGCGTGNTATQIARQFPGSRVLGVDLTPNSVAIARDNAIRKGVQNADFHVDNLLTMDLKQTFDVILNIGVLHHLSDMHSGVENLARHLADDGYLVLWLYGRYGRFRLNLNQRMFRVLFQKIDDLPTKVALTKRALGILPKQYTSCHFNVPSSNFENDFERSIEFAFDNEAWLVDQFLHVNEQVVSMEDILALLDSSGLRLSRWLSVSQDIRTYAADEEIVRAFEALGWRDQLLVLDLLLKPNYYLVVAEKGP